MKLFFFAMSISSIVFLVGCASGLNQAKVSQLLNSSAFQGEKIPIHPESFGKTAVWMNMETMNSKGELENIWKWNKNDFNLTKSYLDTLLKEKKISSYFFIKTSELEYKNIDSVIKKSGADTNSAITIKTIVETDKYFNPVAILDLTIIGAYWFPGSNRDAYAKTRIELIDIQKQNLIAFSEGEGKSKITKPSFLINTEEAVEKAKLDSLRNALRTLLEKLSYSTKLIQ